MADAAQDFYNKSIAEGHTPDQIAAWLAARDPKAAAALQEGHSLQDVLSYSFAHATPPGGNSTPNLQAAPPQMTGFARAAALVASNELEGAEDTLGVPGDLLQAGVAHLPAGVRSVIQQGQNLGVLPNLPSGTDFHHVTGNLGLTNRLDLTPGWGEGGDAERIIAAAARGYGSALPATVLGPAEAIAPTLASGTVGGAGEEAWRERFPATGTGGALTAGLLAGTATGNLANVGTRVARAAEGQYGPEGAEFVAAGLPLRSAALTSGKASTRNSFGQFAPIETTHGDIQRGVEDIAGKLGGSTTLQDAGTYAQAQAQDWLKTTLPAKETIAWQPVDKAIPALTPAQPTSLLGVLKSITGKGGSLNNVVAHFQPGLPAVVQKDLQKRLSALTSIDVQPTWKDLRELRSSIGAAMSDPSIAPKAGARNLQAMYAGITQDLSRVAKAHGAADLFAEANTESSRLHDFAENLVGKIVNSKNDRGDPVPEKVAAQFLNPTALRRGGTDLANLNSEMPDVTKELAAAHLINAVNPKGANAPTVGSSLIKNWQGMSPEAQAALVTDPRIRARLDAMSGVAQRLGMLARTPASGSAAHSGIGATAAATAIGIGSFLLHHLLPQHAPNLQQMFEAGSAMTGAGMLAGGARNHVLSTLANNSAVARYAASLPPGWVLPPSVSAAAGAGAGWNGGNGLEER